MALSDKAKKYLFWALTDKPLSDEVSGAIDAGVPTTDLASTSANKGASLVGIQDTGNFYTSTTVEGALQEVFTDLASTSASKGASLVGIQDAGSIYAATTVEAALAEVKTEADTATTFNNTFFRTTTTLTPSEANAGKILLSDAAVGAGKKAMVEGIQITVNGSTDWASVASSTALGITDTSPSSNLFTILFASLTGNSVLAALDNSNILVDPSALNGGITTGRGLRIQSNGTHDTNAGSTLTINIWGRLV